MQSDICNISDKKIAIKIRFLNAKDIKYFFDFYVSILISCIFIRSIKIEFLNI